VHLWLTMITGCRRSELCSLRWRHLDVTRSTLWVSRSTSHLAAGAGGPLAAPVTGVAEPFDAAVAVPAVGDDGGTGFDVRGD
jgi:hypothetical protein